MSERSASASPFFTGLSLETSISDTIPETLARQTYGEISLKKTDMVCCAATGLCCVIVETHRPGVIRTETLDTAEIWYLNI